MDERGRWISGLLVLASGAIAWCAFGANREDDSARGVQHTTAAGREPEPRPSDSPVIGQRTEVLVHHEASPPADEPQAEVAGEAMPVRRSPLAMDLDNVAASFLTAQPRVTDLLDLVEQMASQAVVEPDSVTIQRSQAGELLSARGALAIGDLRGTFQIDPDGYRIMIRSGTGDAPWSQRDIHINFEESDSRPRGCHALVQFHPGPVEPSSGALVADDEKLVGWSVGTSLVAGTQARPLTLSMAEGEWRISDSERLQAQEFPWVSETEGFTAWLRLLEPYASSPPPR